MTGSTGKSGASNMPDPARAILGGVSTGRSAARRDQLIALALCAVLFLGALLLRPAVASKKRDVLRAPGTAGIAGRPEAAATLKRLAIEFPRLTLGGFRGLLATILWQRAEESKNERQWTRLETQYDYIALLQPYIISVYVFHAWNQAYNLSAQFHEEVNKYKWVLDGLSYLYNGETFNPASPDLELEQANMYFLKLGGAFEREFYRQQFRLDLSRLYELSGTREETPETAALTHIYNFARRPEFKLELMGAPGDRGNKKGYGIEIKDFPNAKGELVTLQRRFGVSPFYFAFRSFERVVELSRHGRTPSTVGMNVVHAWPAMSLRMWCRDDLFYTNKRLSRVMGSPRANSGLQAAIRQEMEAGRDGLAALSRSITRDPGYRAMFIEMRDCYDNVAIVGPRALVEFESHLAHAKTMNWPMSESIHRKHMRETEYYIAVAEGERALLLALDRLFRDNGQLTPEGQAIFLDAIAKYKAAQGKIEDWLKVLFGKEWQNAPDRVDYIKFSSGIQTRIDGIQALFDALKRQDGKTMPNLAAIFEAEVVER